MSCVRLGGQESLSVSLEGGIAWFVVSAPDAINFEKECQHSLKGMKAVVDIITEAQPWYRAQSRVANPDYCPPSLELDSK